MSNAGAVNKEDELTGECKAMAASGCAHVTAEVWSYMTKLSHRDSPAYVVAAGRVLSRV
jgi:hypothetical protein